MTNHDWIKTLSVDQMALLLADICQQRDRAILEHLHSKGLNVTMITPARELHALEYIDLLNAEHIEEEDT